AFDRDNIYHYLNDIPFADHGALLDPPTSDVTARCVAFLGKAGGPESRPSLERAVAFLKDAQEPSGPWFGRWGTNYIYGTWSVLEGIAQAGWDMQEDWIQKAVNWLKGVQQSDGGWGEGNDTYFQPEMAGQGATSTPFQTAWAVLALLAAGEGEIPEIRKGVDFLLRNQMDDGLWSDPQFTAPGFPRVFHLKYHGYNKYFPLQALARYRQHRQRRGPW
ncbi:MAG: prenyltransferase/squalene oxidase repeat-containing protein, partial [Thiohalorhabdaceae bacterium]